MYFHGKVLAWHLQNPELNPQHCTKKKEILQEENMTDMIDEDICSQSFKAGTNVL
jgi:hypothetical protein